MTFFPHLYRSDSLGCGRACRGLTHPGIERGDTVRDQVFPCCSKLCIRPRLLVYAWFSCLHGPHICRWLHITISAVCVYLVHIIVESFSFCCFHCAFTCRCCTRNI